MSMTQSPVIPSLTKLRVADEDFLVTSMIERCPKIMMLRELVQNALEAAALAPEGRREVEILTVAIDGTPKLAIRNTGPGLDATELHDMCDIASSIRKKHGLDENFGMGAKVASLPSNQLGMRYRSCKAGRVHEVIIGKRDDIYGRILRPDANGKGLVDVIEVTNAAQAEGRALDHDWTEVVLLGNRAEQDTVRDPYDGAPQVLSRWIVDELYLRFYRLPPGIVLRLAEGTHPRKGGIVFQSLSERIAAGRFAQAATLEAEGGVRITYIHDPQHKTNPRCNASLGDGTWPDHSIGAIVFRNELYNLRKRWRWNVDAPNFGIPFAARHLSVHVELPDDFLVRADGYRQFLRYHAGAQDQVKLEDFRDEVVALRPDWLLRLIAEFSPDSGLAKDFRGMVQDMLRSLAVPRHVPAAVPTAPRPKPAAGDAAPPPRQPDESGKFERAPHIFMLRQEREVEDRGLLHRAARYYPELHQLFINMRYEAVDKMARALDPQYDTAPNEGPARRAPDVSEQMMVQRIGRALVFGLARRDRPDGWSAAEKKIVLSSEMLTIAADDYFGSIFEARAILREELARTAPAGENFD